MEKSLDDIKRLGYEPSQRPTENRDTPKLNPKWITAFARQWRQFLGETGFPELVRNGECGSAFVYPESHHAHRGAGGEMQSQDIFGHLPVGRDLLGLADP